MAGLGESCNHIAAILFWTKTKVKFFSSQRVTDKECYWFSPKYVGKIVPQPAYKIDFTSAKMKKGYLTSLENAPLKHCHGKKVT